MLGKFFFSCRLMFYVRFHIESASLFVYFENETKNAHNVYDGHMLGKVRQYFASCLFAVITSRYSLERWSFQIEHMKGSIMLQWKLLVHHFDARRFSCTWKLPDFHQELSQFILKLFTYTFRLVCWLKTYLPIKNSRAYQDFYYEDSEVR